MFLFGRSGPLWMSGPQRKQILASGKRMKRGVCEGGASRGDIGAFSVMLHIKVSRATYLVSYPTVEGLRVAPRLTRVSLAPAT